MEMVTKAEKEALAARLAELVANRGAISIRIAEARAHGDLRENGDYHAAREQQGLEEAEIRRLQDRIGSMSVVDEKMNMALKDTVFIGAMVKLRDEGNGDEDMYKLVGEASTVMPADYVEVTATSPMGEALLKAKVGETVRVNAPRGVKRFTVVEIGH
jgi:transcription elongation factor GreA